MTTLPIHVDQDFYVPHFELRLRDRGTLPDDVVRDVVKVSYSDDVDAIDKFEVTINNWDAETRDYKYLDSDVFDPGKELELWMGYYGGQGPRRMITGEITALKPMFPASGQPTLVVTGLNLLHGFREKENSFIYEGQTDSEIAKLIGNRLGLDVDTDATAELAEERFDYLIQDDEYDAMFLLDRARRLGYDLFVEEDDETGTRHLYFGPSTRRARPMYELVYGQSLVQFQPNLSTANQVGKVTVKGWDAVNKAKLSYTATRSELATQGLGPANDSVIEKAVGSREEVIADQPVHSLQEAKTLAIETLQNIEKGLVSASGTVVGLPDLRAGRVVQVDGLGSRFSGRYFVVKTTHTISDAGYTTKFESRREEVAGP